MATGRLLYDIICPSCHSLQDGFKDASGGNAMPQPGSLAMCAYCASLNEYISAGAVLSLSIFPDKEFQSLDPEIRRTVLAELAMIKRGPRYGKRWFKNKL